MPQYVFECPPCNVRFTRTLKMNNYLGFECPSCKEQAPRVLDGEGFAFQFQKAEGAPIANSGVHDHDYPTADKVVGRSAEERWAVMRARDEVKAQAREQGGTHALIRHTEKEGIGYEPMTPVGRDARRKLAKHAIETVRASRESGKSG
jgi:putative FmdB family regulatory protein